MRPTTLPPMTSPVTTIHAKNARIVPPSGNIFIEECITESPMGVLYGSAVNAFPNTTMRQHATGPIQIDEVRYIPFLGMKTLLCRCRATNEERVYRPVVLFSKVDYEGTGSAITASDNKRRYEFNSLTEGGTNCRVRCQCGDFFWRFHHYDWLDLSLYSSNRKPYDPTSNRGPINPTESPGICKHLMKFMETLRSDGVFK